MGEFSQGIGGQGSQQNQLCPLAQFDMQGPPLIARPKILVGIGGVARQGTKGEGCDKVLGGLGQDDSNLGIGLSPGRDQTTNFVQCNPTPAPNDEMTRQAFSRQRVRGPSVLRKRHEWL